MLAPHAKLWCWWNIRYSTNITQDVWLWQVSAADVTTQLCTGSAADVPSFRVELQRIASSGALLVCPTLPGLPVLILLLLLLLQQMASLSLSIAARTQHDMAVTGARAE